MKNDVILRIAIPDDTEALLKIYAPYIKETAITFEYSVPGVAEFRSRIENTLKKYPYIVAEANGQPVGYAYTGAFKARAAYSHSVETSIYIDKSCRHGGIGKLLYERIEAISKAQNITNMYACIAGTETPDEHLDNNSIGFHTHIGYKEVGKFHKCGLKFGTWYDMVFMEKIIAEHEGVGDFIPFPETDFDEILKV